MNDYRTATATEVALCIPKEQDDNTSAENCSFNADEPDMHKDTAFFSHLVGTGRWEITSITTADDDNLRVSATEVVCFTDEKQDDKTHAKNCELNAEETRVHKAIDCRNTLAWQAAGRSRHSNSLPCDRDYLGLHG
eukprot:4912618-Amphidinium_carterae.2